MAKMKMGKKGFKKQKLVFFSQTFKEKGKTFHVAGLAKPSFLKGFKKPKLTKKELARSKALTKTFDKIMREKE